MKELKDILTGLVERGYDKGIVKVIDSPHDDGAVCEIKNGTEWNWFYFGGLTAEELNAEEYVAKVPEENIVREISDVLMDFAEEKNDEFFLHTFALLEKVGTDNDTDAIRDLLRQKAEAELEEWKNELLTKPAKEVMDNAYQKVVKENILGVLESIDEPCTLLPLLMLDRPLDYCFTEWIYAEPEDLECYFDFLRDMARTVVKDMGVDAA